MTSSCPPHELREAWRLAAERHQAQTFPGTQLPYLLHIAQVVGEVGLALAQRREDVDARLALLCAVLHDTLEDTATTRDELAARFGEAVAAGVDALTKRDAATKAEKMHDSLQRILAQPVEVAMVKLADRITNLQPPPAHWSREKILAYAEEARVILQSLGDRCPILGPRLAQALDDYLADHAPASAPGG
jgi:(p)ppGpp synthase/HD superfamily hydrolase